MSITVKEDGTFTVAGIEFIKFPAEGDRVPVMAKECIFHSQFGSNNDLRQSDVLKKMEDDVLHKIIEAVGEDNVLGFKTLDFYRANVEIFDKHKVDQWFWLATPESAATHDYPYWVLFVAPSGRVGIDIYVIDYGVRPFLYFHSSIFGSCGE